MEPSNYIIWNTLGIVAASDGEWPNIYVPKPSWIGYDYLFLLYYLDVSNPELSQHSFIKSIQSQKVSVWVVKYVFLLTNQGYHLRWLIPV